MSTALATLHNQFPIKAGSLESYLYTVSQIPILSAEEEQKLAAEYYYHKDVNAARQLVVSHLRFVVKVARGYLGYGLSFADLIQEGNIGLMKAVHRFNPEVGVRLVTFAMHWIKAEIHEFVLRNWRIVKVATTKAQRKLFFNLRQLKNKVNQLSWFTREERQTVAQELNVSEAEVERMEARMHSYDMCFDAPQESDDQDMQQLAPAQYLTDSSYNPFDEAEAADSLAYTGHAIHEALESLDERARYIVTQRWLVEKKATLHDLAKRFQVSAERIRQLEAAAFAKLKNAIEAH